MSFHYYSRDATKTADKKMKDSSEALQVAAIHKAIRDGEYNQLPDLVKNGEDDNHTDLLWAPNCSGWTALHFAAAHVLPVYWWEWILDKAANTKNPRLFLSTRNALGQSVLDIFFKSYFDPLPWQSIQVKNRSTYLKMAIQQVCADEMLQENLKAWIKHRASFDVSLPVSTNPAAIHCCLTFYMALESLSRAVMHTSVLPCENIILHVCALSGSCPAAVAELILCLHPESAITGSLPLLHVWAASRTNCKEDQDGMLQPLLQAYPEAVTLVDSITTTGRRPLQIAIAAGKSWDCVRPIWELAPDVLQSPDPVTALPLACLAATAPRDCVEIRARQLSAGEKGLVSMWSLMPANKQNDVRQRAAVALDCERLTTIYQILRVFPGA